jgi:hypothetical protein
MNRLRTFVVLAALAVLGTAGVTVAAAQWTGFAKVTQVHVGYGTDKIFVNGLSNVAGCNQSLIVFTPTDSDPKKVHRLAMSAFLGGKSLTCVVDGCSGDYQRGKQCYMK